jgi:hypothetical protein
MNANAKDVNKILEGLALRQAADTGLQGSEHGSCICKLPAGSWQADILRKTADMPQARNPMELRQAMADPAKPVIFLAHDAILTHEVINRICTESPLNKMIIWEA